MEVYCHLVNTKDTDKFVESPVINQSFWTDELGQTVQIKTGRIEDGILIRLLNFLAVPSAVLLGPIFFKFKGDMYHMILKVGLETDPELLQCHTL